ncbi:aminotransferase [Pikeienuella piscinae]|uniref:aspartate transaminase n=1 Tax=Pikeienuella piscinae TaxID=2748098 RepID=A0A7L5BT26_9RHOB|nr:aminotransferase [Pikeienuella piscinae]QIE54031.1 aminotransferase [Pikeienuella piscinae]
MPAAPFNPALAGAAASPIMTAQGWLRGRTFPDDRPLINLSQAAPLGPPPLALREAMARAALSEGAAHLYGPVPGDDALRAEIASRWSALYAAPVDAAEVAVTSGCNEGFAAAILSLAGAGDEVILPNPWYFNHKMWLDMIGAKAVPLSVGEDCLPDPAAARALITPRTRAIALVTPNNPTGAEYPPALLDAFFDLAAEAGLALVVDETYRDYLGPEGPPHRLFQHHGWRDTLIQLYSFSKAYRLTGHRVGALVAGPARQGQIEKFLDTVTICPSRIGQIAALEGLRTQSAFVAAQAAEFLARRQVLEAEFAHGVGAWRLLGAGAYFAWVAHPFEMAAEDVAKELVTRQSLLALPGTMFAPPGDAAAGRTLRLAFANVDRDGIRETARRLRMFAP